MNISKKSWHYRFIKFMDIPQPPPKNLCAYVALLVLLSFVVLVFALLIPIWAPFLGVAWVIATILDSERYQNWKFTRRMRKLGQEQNPKPIGTVGLFMEWVRAKKRKVCPVIEYTDD